VARQRKQAPASIANLDAADLGPLAAAVAVLVEELGNYERRRASSGSLLTLRDAWAHAAFAAIACEEEVQRLAPTDSGAVAAQLSGTRRRVSAFLDLYHALKSVRAAGAWLWGPGGTTGPLPPPPDLAPLLAEMRLVAAELGAGGVRAEPILTDADRMILCVLSDAGRALPHAAVVQDAARLLGKIGGTAAREAGLILLSESKLTERIPLLEEWGLVCRPVGPGGKPTKRRGVGITEAGRKALAGSGPAPPPR
jgi:hypothetical protein